MVPFGAVILRSRSLTRLRVRLLVAVCAAPSTSVQTNVARMGLAPSHTKLVVRDLVALSIVFSIILGASKLALCARMTSDAALPFMYPHPYW